MKILYGVPGEGMGHATRSKVVIEFLIQEGHELKIVSSNRAYHFLSKHFGERVIQIEGFHLAYNNAKVSKLKTLTSTLKTGPKNLLSNYKKYDLLKSEFTPDLVISDFESFSFLFAKLNKIPFISIDNMQVINRCKMDIAVSPEEKNNYKIANTIIQVKVPGAAQYFITTFFYPAILKEPSKLVPPIVRPEIQHATVTDGNHIVVYQTSTSQTNLIRLLQEVKEETFLVYGFNKDEDHGNVKLKSFSEAGFISDLASSKAVIANGGFSFISEAVYLHKPICSVPIKNQFEQYVNASWIQKEGYGRHFDDFHPDGIKAFLYELPSFRRNLSNYQQSGNQILFQELSNFLTSLGS